MDPSVALDTGRLQGLQRQAWELEMGLREYARQLGRCDEARALSAAATAAESSRARLIMVLEGETLSIP